MIKNPVTLSIIFPAYNEEERIYTALINTATFAKLNKKMNIEVIVVENGSTDRTYERAIDTALEVARKPIHNIAVRVERSSPGKGSAVRYGMELSKGKHVLITDVDLSTPLMTVHRLLSFIPPADVVIGSRNLPGSTVMGRTKKREITGNAFTALTSFLVPGIKDTQCGFKLLTNGAVKTIGPLLTIDGFAYDVELLYIARRLDYYISEVPVTWINDDRSTVRVIPDSLKMARDLIGIKLNHATGSYKD